MSKAPSCGTSSPNEARVRVARLRILRRSVVVPVPWHLPRGVGHVTSAHAGVGPHRVAAASPAGKLLIALLDLARRGGATAEARVVCTIVRLRRQLRPVIVARRLVVIVPLFWGQTDPGERVCVAPGPCPLERASGKAEGDHILAKVHEETQHRLVGPQVLCSQWQGAEGVAQRGRGNRTLPKRRGVVAADCAAVDHSEERKLHRQDWRRRDSSVCPLSILFYLRHARQGKARGAGSYPNARTRGAHPPLIHDRRPLFRGCREHREFDGC